MHYRFYTVLLLFFLCTGAAAHSSNAQSRSKEIAIRFEKSSSAKAAVNEIISLLASGAEKQPEEIELKMHLTSSAKANALLGSSDPQGKARVNLRVDRIEGHTGYRNFDMSPFMKPSYYSFRIIQTNAPKPVELVDFGLLHADADGSLSYDFFFENKERSKEFKLEVKNTELYFRDDALEKFKKAVKTVNDYYRQEEAFEVIKQSLSEYRPFGTKLPTEIELRLLEEKMANMSFIIDFLDLSKNDPIDLNPEFKNLSNQINLVREDFEKSGKAEYLSFHRQGVAKFNSGREHEASLLFEKALEHKPDYAPSHFQLARIAYFNGNFDDAEERLINIMKLNSLTQEDKLNTQALMDDLYAYYRGKGDQSARNLEFELAMTFFEKAENICAEIHAEDPCGEEVKARISKTKQAYLEFLVFEARREMNDDDFLTSRDILYKAQRFKAGELEGLSDQGLLSGAYFDLYENVLKLLQDDLENKRKDNAKRNWNLARELCESNQFKSDCTDVLMKYEKKLK